MSDTSHELLNICDPWSRIISLPPEANLLHFLAGMHQIMNSSKRTSNNLGKDSCGGKGPFFRLCNGH